MRCANCNRINPDGAEFCSICGRALGAAATVPTAAVAPGGGTVTTSPGAPPVVAAPNAAAGPLLAASFNAQSSGSLSASMSTSAPVGADAARPGVQVYNNISMTAAAPSVVVVNQQNGPGLLVRGLYFVFIGLWVGGFCTTLAWMFNLTIIGLPLGLMIINRLPQIMTLKPTTTGLQVTIQDGVVVVQQGIAEQRSFAVRALYFIFIGSWFSGLWMEVAWLLAAVTFGLGLPLSFWMFNRVPAITTLRR